MSHARRPRAQSLPFPALHRGREALLSIALVAFVVLFWAHHYRFFDNQSWSQPLDYYGDALFTAGVVKACEQGAYVPFLSKMVWTHGAPYVASWNDWPIPEDLVFCGTGYLARLIGLYSAINVAFVGAGVLAALSMFLVMSALRIRWHWRFLFAGLFGVAPFLFVRSFHHFNLVFYWHAPWCVLVSMWAASRFGIPWRSRRFFASCVVGAAAGFQNPYFLNFFLQMLVLSTCSGLLRHEKTPRKKSVLTVIAIMGVCFFLSNMDTIFYQAANGPNRAATARTEVDLENFALKPFELVFPQPPHVIPAFDRAAFRHLHNTVIRTENEYLGVVGAIALLSTLGTCAWSLMKRRLSMHADLGMLIVWLMGYSVVAGMNALLGVLGFVLFRGANRASIFIMAISLIVFGLLVTRATRRWKPWVQALIAAVILPFAAYEQVLPRRPAAEVDALHQQASADAALVAIMQSKLPRGSRVFQLPAVDFPEVSFEPFRPFLWSDGLSFSFANMKGRPEAEWHHKIAALPPAEMLAELDKEGFKAIFLLEDGKKLAEALAAIRPVELHESTGSNASLILLSK